MKKKILGVILFAIVGIIFTLNIYLASFILYDSKFSHYLNSSPVAVLVEPYIIKFENLIGQLEGKPATRVIITREEVLSLINKERQYGGIAPLSLVGALDRSAKVKLDDMTSQQYFEHVSPQGTDVSELAARSGYDFIVVGENLAVGPFSNAADLVAAWMESPGHRANILNTSYKDTGIAVEYVRYKGVYQWLAVEHFGTQTSVCPQISVSLKSKIALEEADLKSQSDVIDTLGREIETLPAGDSTRSQKIDQYNELVSIYNSDIKKVSADTKEYNNEVSLFNACASHYKVGEEVKE